MLRELQLGHEEGKDEFGESNSDWMDSFYIPPYVSEERLTDGRSLFVEGLRGNGKTSYLRWFAEQRRREQSAVIFYLFKTDFSENARREVSKSQWYEIVEIDTGKYESVQDFKSHWEWFILNKIGSFIYSNKWPCDGEKDFLRLLGLGQESAVHKVLGSFPKVNQSEFEVSFDVAFFKAKFSGQLIEREGKKYLPLELLNEELIRCLKKIIFRKHLYILFDELEVFFDKPEQFRRDQIFVRDCLFAVNKINGELGAGRKILVIAAVRTEILNSFGPLGQEIERVVRGKSEHLSWYDSRRSKYHPIMLMMAKKIAHSLKYEYISEFELQKTIIEKFFPNKVSGLPLDAYLLDRSFFKPRDIVQRLNAAARVFPDEESFSEDVLVRSEKQYSVVMLQELELMLSANFSKEDIGAIKLLFSGKKPHFFVDDILSRIRERSRFSAAVRGLSSRVDVAELLNLLFKFGAVGNEFRASKNNKAIRNCWVFRGDSELIIDRRMVLNRSLWRALSVGG